MSAMYKILKVAVLTSSAGSGSACGSVCILLPPVPCSPSMNSSRHRFLLTSLVPVLQAASWAALLISSLLSVHYVGAFYWAWAVKNIIAGLLKQDLAGLTSAAVAAAEVFSTSSCMQGIPAAILVMQFSTVALKVCPEPAKKVAKAIDKPIWWAQIFGPYLIISAAYWGVISYKHFSQ